MMATERERAMGLCMRVGAMIPVDQMSTGFPWPMFLRTLGGDVDERAGEEGELLVGRVEVFWAVEDEHRRGKWIGDMYSNVGVCRAVEDVLWSATSVKGEQKAHLRSR